MNTRTIVTALFVVTAALELGGCAQPRPAPQTGAHALVDFAIGDSPRAETSGRERGVERVMRWDMRPTPPSTRRH